MSPELGFNNTWALAMRREAAQRLSIRTISDLRTHPELKYGLTHEFLDRRDGWPALVRRYGLPTGNVHGIDHGLGYEALRTGSIDIKDAYSTDAKIGENDLVTRRRPSFLSAIQGGLSLSSFRCRPMHWRLCRKFPGRLMKRV